MDSFQRAVLRRYEPMPGSAVTALLASQAKEGDKSMRWALAGEAAAPKVTPLGSNAAPPGRSVQPTGAKATAPVKKAEAAAPAPAAAPPAAAVTSGTD
jgi:hypothetical protein